MKNSIIKKLCVVLTCTSLVLSTQELIVFANEGEQVLLNSKDNQNDISLESYYDYSIEDTNMSKKTFSERLLNDEVEEIQNEIITLDADGNIASGSYENVTWVIDSNGQLSISGTGNYAPEYKNPDWYDYRESIKSAVVSLKDVTSLNSMFLGCDNLVSVDLSELDTSNVKVMRAMFEGCKKLVTVDVSRFITSNVTDMSRLFMNCRTVKTLNVSGFDTSNVTDMSYMFYECRSLETLDISHFNTSNVTSMEGMFASTFDTDDGHGVDIEGGGNALTYLDVSHFDTSNVIDMSSMFAGCIHLKTLDISKFNTSKVTDMSSMFSDCYEVEALDVSGFDTSNVVGMRAMFCGCNKVKTLDVSKFNTSRVKDMSSMFQGFNFGDAWMGSSNQLTSLDVSGFDTSKVENMCAMFYNCGALHTIDVSGFDTSKVTDMGWMFNMCYEVESLDVSGFDTSNVTNMRQMFLDCANLKTLNVSGFDTTNVTDMGCMFQGCSSLTNLDVSNFVTSKVVDMDSMFWGCSQLKVLNVGGFDTSKAEYIARLFRACASIETLDLSSFDLSRAIKMGNMVDECSSLTSIKSPISLNADISLPGEGWMNCTTQESVNCISVGTPKGTMFTREETVKVDSIELDQAQINLNPGEIGKVSATVFPVTANASDIVWISSDEEIVSVKTDIGSLSKNMVDAILVTGTKEGNATVTAKIGDVSASAIVSVINPVKFDKHEMQLISIKDSSDTIIATVKEGYSLDTLIWTSSDETVATVDKGVVYATEGLTEESTVVITAETPDRLYKDTCTVTVVPAEKVKTPTASIPSGEVEEGTLVELSCESLDADIFYTVDGSVPALDTSGNPTGTTKLFSGGIKIKNDVSIKAIAVKDWCNDSDVAEFAYTVKKEPVPDNTIDIRLVIGGKVKNEKIAKTAEDGKGYKIVVANNKIATVNNSGFIQGKKVGSTTATITKNDKEYKLNITVVDAGFTKTNYIVNAGDTVAPIFVAEDIEISSFTSSKPEVVSVYSMTDGLFIKANSKGTSKISVVCDGKKYSTTVRVYDPVIFGSDIVLLDNKTISLSIKNGTGKTVWSIDNEGVATIKNGKIKGVSKGTATVTATNNGRTMTRTINVYNVPKFDKKVYETNVGTPIDVTLTKDSDMRTPQYSVSNIKIATIDSSGKVTPIKKGTVTVTAEIGGKKYKTKVKIK
ncbi:MAG: BspA family leucine-rich repeat surface protein [Lachnospiraceae bacterium]|nr:BspA family leucine-rich repeat surface protein [Lachnospiraceae bacterium]